MIGLEGQSFFEDTLDRLGPEPVYETIVLGWDFRETCQFDPGLGEELRARQGVLKPSSSKALG